MRQHSLVDACESFINLDSLATGKRHSMNTEDKNPLSKGFQWLNNFPLISNSSVNSWFKIIQIHILSHSVIVSLY